MLLYTVVRCRALVLIIKKNKKTIKVGQSIKIATYMIQCLEGVFANQSLQIRLETSKWGADTEMRGT